MSQERQKTREDLEQEIAALRLRLAQLEDSRPAGAATASAVSPWSALIENMGVSAALLSADGLILCASRVFAEMFRLPAELLPGTALASFIFDEHRHRYLTLFGGMQNGPTTGELVGLRATREMFPLLLTLCPMPAISGGAVAALVIDQTQQDELERLHRRVAELEQERQQRDAESAAALRELADARLAALNVLEDAVHARQRSEQINRQLRESEERFRTLVETAPDAISIQSDGCFRYVNRAVLTLYGAESPAQLLERPALDLVHPDYHAIALERRRRVDDAHEPAVAMEQVHLRLDGTPVHVDICAVPFQFEGEPAVLVFARNLTDRKRAEKAAEERTAELDRFFSLALDLLCIADPAGRLLRLNPAWEPSLGYPVAELAGHSLLDFVHEDDAAGTIAAFAEVCARGGIVSFTNRCRHKDGTLRWIEWRVASYSGSLVYAAARDITERLQSEETLRLRNTALEAAANVVVITDRQGRIVWTNPAFTQSTGYTAAEVLGRNPRLLKSNEQDPAIYRQMWETITAGHVWQGEFINVRKDGTRFTEHATITPVRNESGQITHFIAVKQDVSEQKQAEQRLRDQAQLLDLANDAIIVCAPDQTIVNWNQGAERLYGWSKAEALGRALHPLLGRSPSVSEAEIARELDARGSWNGELRQHNREGKEITVISRWTLIRDEQGAAKSILVINADVTERKRLEAQFLRMQRVESIGTLAAGIAHDLNNILAPILMVGPLLEEKVKDDEGRWMLEAARKNAERGASIVKQLLTFAKGSEGELIPLDLTRLLKDMAGIVRETFPKNIRCETSLPPQPWPVLGNLTQLHQVVLNLCLNARDAMPGGGQLRLAMDNIVVDESFVAMEIQARPGPYVVLTVADTGQGIPDDIKERIFDPFFTTKGPDRGTGLGLATVLGIVRSHNGFIRLTSRVGEGSQFKIYLPASDIVDTAGQAAEQTAAAPRGNGELILLVDDEEAVRATSRRALTKFGYRVVEAADGTEGVSRFVQQAEAVRLVITDLQMPYMGGVALIHAVRKIRPDITVLAATGYGSKETLRELEALGIAGVMNKPYSALELLEAVRKVLLGEPLK